MSRAVQMALCVQPSLCGVASRRGTSSDIYTTSGSQAKLATL